MLYNANLNSHGTIFLKTYKWAQQARLESLPRTNNSLFGERDN
jgi:hypothetical protein